MEYEMQLALRKLQDRSSATRCDAVKSLTALESPSEQAVSALAAALQDEDDYVRTAVAGGLARIGAQAPRIAVPALLRALQSEKKRSYVRAYVVDALGAIGARSEEPLSELVPALRELLEDEDFDVRKSAAYALYLIE